MTPLKAQQLFGLEWSDVLYEELNNDEFKRLSSKLQLDRLINIQICPNKEDIFKAFRLTNLPDVKAVIVGQDPFHTVRYDDRPIATGLSFGVSDRSYIPPSLRNIVLELESDLEKFAIDFDYSLESWAKQGVLMLNTALTVQKGNAGSHTKYWESFTKKVFEILNNKTNNTIFILWGNHAKSFKQYLTNPTFKFIESTHPSPFSAHNGFIGSKPFSKANSYLETPINWLEYVEKDN